MGHHTLRRITNLTFAFLLAVFSVNLSGVLSLQNAYAAGNNGTIKIAESEADDTDDSNANDPHINGCSLDVKFYGYDTDTHAATVTFEAQSPTAGQLVSPIGAQNADFNGLGGNGNTLDAIKTFTLAFSGAPQINQGYHVKVTVHADGTQGNDVKHKTVWVTGCEPTTPALTASANVNITDPTCQSASIATVGNTTDAILTSNGGVLDQTVGAHTAIFTADIGHAFADSSTVKSIPYTIATILTGEICAGQKPADEKESRVITESPVCLTNGGGTVTSWTEERTRPYVISGNAWVLDTDDSHWSAWVKIGQDTTHPATSIECPANITPTEPSVVEVCGTFSDRYIIPDIEGVQYSVSKFGIAFTDVAPGSHWHKGTFYVKAEAKPGYLLTGNTAWTLYLNPHHCQTGATNVEFNDECGSANDTVSITTAAHVTYKKLTGWWLIIPIFTPITDGTHSSGFTWIIAEADSGYEINGSSSWLHNFSNNTCDQPFSAEGDPYFTDLCGTANDSYTIVAAANVFYTVNDVEDANSLPGTHTGVTGFVKITAEANDPNFTLTGITTWSHTYTDISCNPCAPPTVPLQLVMPDNQIAIDNNCEPGRGNVGGSDPVDDDPTPPANLTSIELPQTGAKTNPLLQLITVIAAGIVTYGVTYLLVNRRNLTQK